MGAWCKDTRGSKMLDAEVRFGKDRVDQATQISSWRNYCHGHTVHTYIHYINKRLRHNLDESANFLYL